MKPRLVFTCLLLAGLCRPMTVNAGDSVARMDFESVPPGTVYGGGYGDAPGDVVLTEGGIRMSVEVFFVDVFIGFNRATVGGAYDDYFPTTPLELNNVGGRFAFDDLDFDVGHVELEFLDFGGVNNLAVNDEQLFIADDLAQLPTDIATGVTLTVTGGTRTTSSLALDGDITSFRIGGQELAIDNIVATPEPTSLLLLGLGATLLLRRRGRAAGYVEPGAGA